MLANNVGGFIKKCSLNNKKLFVQTVISRLASTSIDDKSDITVNKGNNNLNYNNYC